MQSPSTVALNRRDEPGGTEVWPRESTFRRSSVGGGHAIKLLDLGGQLQGVHASTPRG